MVQNERRLRMGRPEGRQFMLLGELVYPPGHPYREPVIGSAESVEAITREEVCAFRAAHYGPGRATLLIAGRVTRDEVQRLVDSYLAPLPGRPLAPQPQLPPMAWTKETASFLDDDDVAHVYVAWKLPPPDSHLGIAARLLEAQLREHLYRHAEPELLGDVEVYEAGGEDGRYLLGHGEVGDPRRIDAARNFLVSRARDLHDATVEESWLARHVERQVTQSIAAYETLTGRTTRTGDTLQHEHGRTLEGELAGWRAMKESDLPEAASAILTTDGAKVLLVRPRKESPGPQHDRRSSAISTDDHERAVAVDRLPPLPAVGLPFDRLRAFALANGLRVVIVATSALPLTTVSLILGAGFRDDPPGQEGSRS